MKNHATRRGFTLIELTLVIAVISVLTLTAVPSMQLMIQRSQTTAALNRLVTAVNHARHAAVQFRVTTTLCGVKPTGRCGGDWSDDLTVFADYNQNARIDSRDHVISVIKSLGKSSTAKWRSFQNRQYLQMTAMGYTRFQNGNFVVCPKTGNRKLARQIIVNVQGRVRRNHSIDEAGYPIDRNRRPLRC